MDLINFYAIKKELLKKQALSLKVATDSMHPVLKVNQLINVRPCDPIVLKKFDIIVFWDEGKLTSHFLWAKQTDFNSRGTILVTRSLKNPAEIDLPFKEELLLGKVDAKIPTIKKIKLYLKIRFLK